MIEALFAAFFLILIARLVVEVRWRRAVDRLQWAAAHPEERAAEVDAEIRAEVAMMTECGLTETEAWEFMRLRLLADLREFAEAPC